MRSKEKVSLPVLELSREMWCDLGDNGNRRKRRPLSSSQGVLSSMINKYSHKKDPTLVFPSFHLSAIPF